MWAGRSGTTAHELVLRTVSAAAAMDLFHMIPANKPDKVMHASLMEPAQLCRTSRAASWSR